jgi:transcriptional regulator with XRE-family HTH domain
MITGSQIRAARGLIGWSAKELAAASTVSLATVLRLEGQQGIPISHPRTLQDLKRAFEEAGLEFIGTPENGAGVKFKNK